MIITGNFNHDYHDNQNIAHPLCRERETNRQTEIERESGRDRQTRTLEGGSGLPQHD